MRRFMLVIALGVVASAGCQLNSVTGSSTASGEVALWISSDKDTYASYGRVGEDADNNFGRNGSLVVAVGPLARKQSYVHFTVPTFPEGTEILAAKLELYHGGKNEDGFTDDITLNVGMVRNEAWGPLTLTWNNRPDRGGTPAIDFPLYLRSQAWSGTSDIAGAVRAMIADPASYHGFVIFLPDNLSGTQVEKGFYSNNDYRRKQSDLGLSPRLVVRIKLPAGKTTDDMTLPFLPAGHDLGGITQPITTVRFTKSSGWPTEWGVSPER